MSGLKIGDLIKRERINCGYRTQKDFADITGVSPAALSRIEKNTQKPNPETLLAISKHLPTVSYGELMKVAGYLNGLEADHEKFMTDFFNENDKLDNMIFNQIDSLYSYTKIDKELHGKLLELFVPSIERDIYESADNNDFKSIYLQSDCDLEDKRMLSASLEDLINQFPKKLGRYLELVKIPSPIPLLGSICAGDGIIAHEEIESYISYPFAGTNQPDFALRVKGDSMINAGIQNGDIVFLRQEKWPTYNGQIVAVIVNREDATLKRMKWSEGTPKFQLVPENDAYQSMEVTPNEIIVCGTYAGHFRPEL